MRRSLHHPWANAGDTAWYIYCTTDPLNGDDKTGSGFNFHLMPMLKSYDLVHWVYQGAAFTARPSWVSTGAGLWAPDIRYFNGKYYLYYTASDTVAGGSAIGGVATSPSPTGPGTDSGAPVVEPHESPCCPGSRGWTFDPDVISMDGNRWVGTGHNAVFADVSGQDWFVYHAVDRFNLYFAGAVGFTKRPVLMDPLDWVGGWQTVRGGFWASDGAQSAPAAQPGTTTADRLATPQPGIPGSAYTGLSDEFNSTTLSSRWKWVRPPDPATYNESGGTFNMDTQAAELYVDSNYASVLTEPAPGKRYRQKSDRSSEGWYENTDGKCSLNTGSPL